MVKYYLRSIQWLTCMMLVIATAEVANAGVILHSSFVSAYVSQDLSFEEDSIEVNPLLNSTGTIVAATSNVSLTMNYSLVEAGGTMAFDVDHSVAPTGLIDQDDSLFILAFSQIVFTAGADGSYAFSGSITQSPGTGLSFVNYLEDLTLHPQVGAHPSLFDYSTNGGIFSPGLVVFGQTPIPGPYNTGSMTGAIIKGHKYILNSFTQYYAWSPATSESHFRVTSDVAAVPEPCSVALWLMCGIGAVTSGYRRRRKLTSVASGRT